MSYARCPSDPAGKLCAWQWPLSTNHWPLWGGMPHGPAPLQTEEALFALGGNSSLQCQGCLRLLQVQVCNQGSELHARDAHVEGSYEKQQASLHRQVT